MDEIFGQVDSWFSPDSIILMRVLISAMDKAREKVHYGNGSMEFLNSRSKYYNIATILVEGCSRMIQEKTEIPETNREKMLLDLRESGDQIQGRLIELSNDIAMKDMEITEWTDENDAKLRQKQETEEREMASLTAKFHFSRSKSEVFSRNRVRKQSKKRLEHIFEGENLNLEKLWGFEVEKDTIIIMIKGFIENLNQRNFDGPNLSKFVEKVIALRNDFMGLIPDEAAAPKPAVPTKLQRTTSEPTPDIRREEKEKEEDEDSDGGNYVAKMIKNHESIIRRQNRELKRLKGEILGGKVHQAFKRLKGTDDDGMERNLRQVIAHLDDIIAWNADRRDKDSTLIDQNRLKLEQERDDSILKMLIMEEIYQLLLKGLVKDFQHRLEDETFQHLAMEGQIREDVFKVFCMEMLNETNSTLHNMNTALVETRRKLEEEREEWSFKMQVMENVDKLILKGLVKDCEADSNESSQSINKSVNCLNSSENMEMEYFIREEIYKVFYREMIKERNLDNFENMTEEEIHKVVKNDEMKDECDDNEHRKTHPKESLDPVNRSLNCGNCSENIEIEHFIREEIYKVFYREMVKERTLDNFGNAITEEIYNVVIIEAMKDVYDDKEEPDKFDKWLKDGLMKKVISLVRSLKMGETLMCKASSEIEEHNTENEMVAMECDEAEERDMIQWLLTGEESTFSSIRDKLEKSLQQLLQCKALLREFLFTLDNRDKLFTFGQTNDEFLSLGAARRLLSLLLTGFKQTLLEFETQACRKLEMNFIRLEQLELEVNSLVTLATSLRKKASLYEKAFIRRCQNLHMAEAEVDMLGDEVDMLVALMGKIYSTLEQHSSVLSSCIPVTDVLKMIKKEMDRFAARESSS